MAYLEGTIDGARVFGLRFTSQTGVRGGPLFFFGLLASIFPVFRDPRDPGL